MDFYYTVSISDVRRAYWDYMPADAPLLLPASSWSPKLQSPKLPPHVKRTAADCGGFVATMKWGGYRYTPDQYVAWLDTWQPEWAATMDYCCEPERAGSGLVRKRQDRTTEMAHLFWSEFRGARWTWVPTIQGWEIADYRRHARELAPLVRDMMTQGAAFRVGIGTLCRRADVRMIHAVVQAVSEELPGVPLHLWGVKLGALQSAAGLPCQVRSVDSAAWNGLFGRDIEKARAERTAAGMSRAQHCWQVMLPRYRAKVEAALQQPKQSYLL